MATNSTFPEEPDDNSIIIGGAIGGAAIAGIIATIIMIISIRRKSKRQENENNKPTDNILVENAGNDFAQTVKNINPDVKATAKPVENDFPKEHPFKTNRDEGDTDVNCDRQDLTKKKELWETNNISSNRGFFQDISATFDIKTEIGRQIIEMEQKLDIQEEMQKIYSDVHTNACSQRFSKLKKDMCITDETDKRSIPDQNYHKHKFEQIQKEMKHRAEEMKLFDRDEADIENKIKMAFEKENKSDDNIEGSNECNINENGNIIRNDIIANI